MTGLAVFSSALRMAQARIAPKKSLAKQKPIIIKNRGQAKNAASVLNASVDFQKIKTAEIEIPVIAADVLTYEPGELGDSYPERTRLYYAPEALWDPEYLETVLRSPLQIQTHEKNTTEFNRGVDGWPLTAFWDEKENRVKAKGVLHGEENVKYASDNKNKPNFGTSAYISFLQIERTPGTSPDGKPYDAIVRKAVNNHIAILPNIRDPKNIILAMNAVQAENKVDESELQKWIKELRDSHPDWKMDQVKAVAYKKIGEGKNAENPYQKQYDAAHKAWVDELVKEFGEKARELSFLMKPEAMGKPGSKVRELFRKKQEVFAKWLPAEKGHIYNSKETKGGQKMAIDKEEFKEAMMAYEEDGKKEEELVNKIKNAVLNELNPEKKEETKNEEPKKEEEKKAENAEEEPKKEEKKEEAANALPSESMVKDFSDALGITFKTTPTLQELASLSGVEGKNAAELITALNAKRETLKNVSAKNERTEKDSVSTVNELIRNI